MRSTGSFFEARRDPKNASFEASLVEQLSEFMRGDPGTSLSPGEHQPDAHWEFEYDSGKVRLIKAGPFGKRNYIVQDDAHPEGYPARLLMIATVDKPLEKLRSRSVNYTFYSLRPDNFAATDGDKATPVKAPGKVRPGAEFMIIASNSIIRNTARHRGLQELQRVTTQVNLTKLPKNVLPQIS